MTKLKWISISGFIVFVFFFFVIKRNHSAENPITFEWISKFREFSNALNDYNQRNNQSVAELMENESKLFPEDFGILHTYGDQRRDYLTSPEDFRKFEKSIVIAVEDYTYFVKNYINPESIAGRVTVIAYKEFVSKNGSRYRIRLRYYGGVDRDYAPMK